MVHEVRFHNTNPTFLGTDQMQIFQSVVDNIGLCINVLICFSRLINFAWSTFHHCSQNVAAFPEQNDMKDFLSCSVCSCFSTKICDEGGCLLATSSIRRISVTFAATLCPE